MVSTDLFSASASASSRRPLVTAAVVAMLVGAVYALICWWNGPSLSGEPLRTVSLQLTGFQPQDGGFIGVGADERALHVIAASVALQRGERVAYRFRVLRPPSTPSTVRVDLFAPGYDAVEQESAHVLSNGGYPQTVSGSFATGNRAPVFAQFRVFYEGGAGLQLTEIRVVRVPAWRLWLEHVLALATLLSVALFLSWAITLWLSLPPPSGSTAIWMLVALYGVGLAVRFAISMLLPYWSGDEYAYKGIAAGLWAGGGAEALDARRLEHSVDLPNALYPLLIAPAIGLGDDFYTGIRLINAAVMTTVVFPAFAIARRLASARIAFVVAVVALTLPSANIAAFAATEVLYYPVVLGVLWLTLRAVSEPQRLGRQLVLGVAIAVALNVRLTALALMPAYLVSLLFVHVRDRTGRSLVVRPYWLACVGAAYLANVLLRTLMSNGAGLGVYANTSSGWTGVAREIIFADPSGVAALLGGHAAILALPYSLGIAALVARALSRTVPDAARRRDETVVLIGFLAAFALAIVFTLSVSKHDLGGLERWHSRYYFAYLPLLVASAATFFGDTTQARGAQIGAGATLGLIITCALAFVATSAGFASPWFGSMVDSMEAQWMHVWGGRGVVLAFIAAAALVLLSLRQRSSGFFLAGVLVWLAFANVATWCTLKNSPGADDAHCGAVVSRWLQANPGKVTAVASTREDLVDLVFWMPYLPEAAVTLPAGKEFNRGSAAGADYIAVEGDTPVGDGPPLLAVGRCHIFRAN